MRVYAGWIVRPRVARSVVVLTLVAAVGAGVFAARVEQDDDLLAFLPEGDPAVRAFNDISRHFGGLDVALVGIQAPDVLAANMLDRLRILNRRLEQSPRVDLALSLASVEDFSPAEGGGIRTELLVPEVPGSEAAREALRAKIASRDLVLGQLVAENFSALLVYVFAQPGADPRAFADDVRTRVTELFDETHVYFGGAPFVSTYIYQVTQDDLRALTPWAVLVVVLLVVAAFRDLYGAALALASTAMGIVFCLGLMGVVGARTNIVLSSMPVILFSVGSAYAIHILARYYALAGGGRLEPSEALRQALVTTGPTVLAAGLTTVAGLMSFMAMDVAPLRTFGLFTAVGIFATLLLALAFVPAVVVTLGLRPRQAGTLPLFDAIAPLVSWVARHRAVGLMGIGVLAVVGAVYASRVEARMDQTAFFGPDSEPARADRFLLGHFGGSVFLQVELTGDFNDPVALAEICHLADRIVLNPRVSSVRHIGQVLEEMNAAFQGERRLPDDVAKTKLLYGFLAGRPAVGQLVTPKRDRALMHILLSTTDFEGIEAVVDEVEVLVRHEVVRRYRRPTPDGRAAREARIRQAATRLRVLAAAHGRRLGASAVESIQRTLRAEPSAVDQDALRKDVEAYLRSEEAIVDLTGAPSALTRVAEAAAGVSMDASSDLLREAVVKALGADFEQDGERAPALGEDLGFALSTVLREARRTQVARFRARTLSPIVRAVPEARVVDAVMGLERRPVALMAAEGDPDAGRLAGRVSGLPVLHRGMSRSAQRNQLWSLALALGLVAVVLSVLFRSLRFGVVAAVPTLMTLLVIYGGMGRLGVHLDIGTSMLASLIIGAGVDYAVHFVAAWRASAGAHDGRTAALETAPAIWTNAWMVASGFYLLTLGEARTLENVGSLTAAAMLTAAMATFVAVPALLGRPEPVKQALAQADLTEERT